MRFEDSFARKQQAKNPGSWLRLGVAFAKGLESALRKFFDRVAVRVRTIRSGIYWGKAHLDQQTDQAYWLEVPEITTAVNRRVGGKPSIWPLSWFLLNLPAHATPVDRALSVGCGPGNLEREVLRHGSAEEIDGIDPSRHSIELAVRQASLNGYGSRISYHVTDASSWLRHCKKARLIYDLIFFHASLHHIEALEEVLQLCSFVLRGGKPGFLYVDEYIGPSRHQWTPAHLGHAAALHARVPAQFRAAQDLLPPVARDDPTEMIRSSEISEVLNRYFEVTAYRPYYGNILMPLVSGIRKSALEEKPVQDILQEALLLEDFLIQRKLIEPMYAVFVARPSANSGRNRPLIPA